MGWVVHDSPKRESGSEGSIDEPRPYMNYDSGNQLKSKSEPEQ